MKKNILAILFLLFCTEISFAQSTYKSKVIYNTVSDAHETYKIHIVDGLSNAGITKVKIRIENLTNDYLSFHAVETYFMIDGEKVMGDATRIVDILPQGFGTVVVEAKNPKGMPSKVSLHVEGMQRISAESKVISVPNLEIPAGANDIKVGDIQVIYEVKETEISNKMTRVVFTVINSADNTAIIDARTIVLNVDGVDYPIVNTGIKPQLLNKGEMRPFVLKWTFGKNVVDVTKAKKYLIWNNTFRVDKGKPIKTKSYELIIDITKSK